LHYSKTEDWGCILYTGAHYIRDFTVDAIITNGTIKGFKAFILSNVQSVTVQLLNISAANSIKKLEQNKTLIPTK